MKELTERLETIADNKNHYLTIAKELGLHYYNEFIKCGTVLHSLLSKREFEFWCEEKMLIKQQSFSEKTFIQYAVETTTARYFGERFQDGFQVEAKINPNNDKDVDCRFSNNDFVYNVEVKCSDFVSKEKVDVRDGFKFGTVGRLPDRGKEAFDAISSALDEGLSKKGEPLKPHLVSKNMDNNLKEFLELAHEKFNPDASGDEINVLLVGCGDEHDLQNWFNYLWASEGLFTKTSFSDKTKYNNVDLVVLTNQYYKHNRFFEKKIKDSWSLDHGFNLIFGNPFRKIEKKEGIRNFLSLIPHYTQELGTYIVPGEAPDYVKNVVRISWFVKDHLEKTEGKYLFSDRTDEVPETE